MVNNIILIGFMGTGKTSVGKRLANLLSYNFIDTDVLIESVEKIKISDIFKKKGEEYFRNLESKIIDTLADYEKFIVATGGGIVLKEENVTKLKGLGPLVLLVSSPKTIYERVKDSGHRPLLDVADPQEKIEELLKKRMPIYSSVADYEIDVSDISPDEAARQILRMVGENE